MTRRFSRVSAVLAAAAALSLAVSPAMARGRHSGHGGGHGGWGGGWGRHHDRIDTGDVLAGILILGTVAAVASAAGKAGSGQRVRTERNTEGDRRDNRPDYADARDGNRPSSRGMGAAVDLCADEVERTDRRVEGVDAVERDGEGWRVEGRVGNGQPFACSVSDSGRIRSVTVAGQAA